MTSTQTKVPSTAAPSGNSQEFIVRVPKNSKKRYHVMKFNAALKIDFAKWSQVKLERENNMKEFKSEEDAPKFGAGSEYGREFREEARRKKYGIISKKYNPDDQPWLLRLGGKTGKKFKGAREGGVTDNSSYYVFMQAQDGAYEAFPIDQWYNFTPIHTYKTLNAEEAEEEFGRRDKVMNYFSIMTRKRLKNDEEEEGEETEKQNKTGKYGLGSGELKISDMDEWVNSSEEEKSEEEKNEEEEKKAKQKPDAKGKGKGKAQGKKKKKKKGSSDEDPLEDSDDGDEEGREIDYISDESSSAEEPEEKGKEEMKGVEDEEAIRKMENSESEEDAEKKENPAEVKDETNAPKPPAKDKKEKKDAGSSSESSSDTSESDDFDNDTSYQSAMFMQKSGKKGKRDLSSGSRGGTPTKHGDHKESSSKRESSGKKGSSGKKESSGHKRHGREPTPPSSKKMKLDPAAAGSGSSAPSQISYATEGINEEAVRRYLSRKPMTTTELLQKFKSKKTGLKGQQMVITLTQILKRLNLDKQMIKGKMYLSIK